ncbi:MAG: CidA/LrgA family protein [Burkholderiaceae bacterium]
MINTITTLLIFQTIGEFLTYAFSLPIPGPVLGMLLLFLFMLWKREAVDKLAPGTSQLLAHMSVFFVPAGVGIIVHINRIANEWLPIAVALIASTVMSIVVTAVVIKRLKK